MDDNATSHRARVVTTALKNTDWPANSFDLNAREQMGDYVTRAVRDRENPPDTFQEMIIAA